MKKDWIRKDFIEELADLEHQQWSHWTDYLFKRLSLKPNSLRVDERTRKDFKRWVKQIITPYKDLSEKEKDADRVWARKVIKLIEDKIKRLEKMYKTLENMQKASMKIIEENYANGKNHEGEKMKCEKKDCENENPRQ